MRDKKILTLPVIILIIAVPFVIGPLWSALTGHSAADVQEKIEDYLYEKYGEEFVVDRIGTRSSRGEEFYQARIYPKSIIGTNREGDDYYYASASVDKLSFGRLGGVGDSYPLVNLKLGIEEHIIPPAKDIFGERILMNIEAHYKRREPGNETFWGYKVDSFEKAREEIAKDPENRMIELELYVYIFDRIDNEEEKEERRKQIFNFVQYLKQEDLFKYSSLVIKIVDEKILTPSYALYQRKLKYSDKNIVNVNGIKVYIPPQKIVDETLDVLGNELEQLDNKELLRNMNKIDKNQLGVNGIEANLMQYFIRICPIEMMKLQPYGEYEEAKNKGNLEKYKYSKIEDIRLGKENLNYIFKNQRGVRNE